MKTAILITGLGLLGACGDVTVHHLPDGPTNGDGGDVDSGPAVVTVHTYTPDRGARMGNVEVVLQAPDGTLTVGFSDSSGELVEPIVANTTVTTIAHSYSATTHVLMTVFGAKPGDTLEMRDYVGSTGTRVGTQSVSVPSYTQATSYYVQTRCYSTTAATTTVPLPLVTPCDSGMQSYAAIAQNDGANVAFLEGKLDANGGAAVALTGTYQPYNQFQFTLNGLDATVETNGIDVYRYTSAAHSDGSDRVTVNGATASGTFQAPTASNAVAAIASYANSFDTFYNGYTDTSYHKLGGSTFSLTVDVGATRAPRPMYVYIDGTQTSLVSDTTVDTSAYKAVRVEEQFYNNVLDTVTGQQIQHQVEWTFIMDTLPTTAAPRALPKLPDDAKIAAPLPDANRGQYYWDVTAITGPVTWDQLRGDYGASVDIEALEGAAASGVINVVETYREDD